MGFKSSKNNTHVKAATSNPGQRNPDDEKNTKANSSQHNGLNNRKIRFVENYRNASASYIVFTHGVKEEKVKRELLMLEFDEDFEERSLKYKMKEVLKKGSEELKDKFYEMAINECLPISWVDFKRFVIEFCTGQSMWTMQKYINESWYLYFNRIDEWAQLRNVSEEEVLKKLRSENLPKEIQPIVYSIGISLKMLIERIGEWESHRSKDFIDVYDKRVLRKRDNESKNYNELKKCFKCNETGHLANKCIKNKELSIKCFKCGQRGHISYDCKSEVKNNYLNTKCDSNIDERIISINNVMIKAIFDTGASDNMICSGASKKIKGFVIKPDKKSYTNFVGEEGKTIGTTNLEFTYEGNKYSEEFNVVDSPEREGILISNSTVKRISGYSISIVGCIETGDNVPISWSRPLRSYRDKNDFELMIEDLENRGVIEKSESEWLNPVVLTRKKNGKLRFCVDFRRLNDLVKQDQFQIPKISELIAQLRDMKYFTVIDLKDGFYHIPIRKEDCKKTAFYTGKRLMQFKKLPQGYKNSPAIFQRAMNLMFNEMIGNACLIYIDDILVFGKNKEEHDMNLEKVFSIMRKYNLSENIEKREECKNEITFLGYKISHNSFKPTLIRAQGILDFITPKNKKSLQRFIGMINYDRQFIKGLSTELRPFYQLLEKDRKFIWNLELEELFTSIKNNWAKELELFIPNFEDAFELETDASNIGLGAVLRQDNRPVGYASRVLNISEKNYSITEKEVLAMLWGMEKFRYYLTGNKFTVITDHKAIEEVKLKQEFGSSRIYRWFDRLERFQFEVKHREGTKMVISDALSREATMKEENKIKLNMIVEGYNEKILRIHEEKDHRKNITRHLIREGIKISERKLKNILNKCELCARKDRSLIKTSQYIKTENPGDKIGVDILEVKKNDKVIVAIDYFSRKIFAKAIKSKESVKVVLFLQELYDLFPFKSIISDNGREFKNENLSKWSRERGIVHRFSVPYYHQSNGRVERANRTIRNALRKSEGTTKQKLGRIVENYNNMVHRGIGITPEEALKIENKEKVINKANKYEKEFKNKFRNVVTLKCGDDVLIKNEHKKDKMEDEFNMKGKVVCVEYGDVYGIKTEKENMLRKHISQLRRGF